MKLANSNVRTAEGRGLIAAFEAIVGSAHVLTLPADMAAYLSEPRDLFKGSALCIVRPGATAEVAAIVRLCSETGTPIVPQGGNTGLVGGQIPGSGDKAIVLSLQRMRALREIDLASNTMTVEAGMILEVMRHRAGGSLRCLVVAPAGLVFTHDANGILLRRVSGGMDYHPEDADWTAKDFATRVRKAMAANWAKRREAKRAAKQAALDAAEAARVAAIRECELATTRVTLDDSRRAGNCVEGSLAFAERKLHFSPRNDFSTNIFAGRGPSSRVERHYSPFAAAPGVSFTEAAWLG